MSERTVSTVEEIKALPERAVLLDRDGDVWQKSDGKWSSPAAHFPAGSYEMSKVWAPLTALTPEHIHDWEPSGRSLLGVVETCADEDCGISRYAPTPAGAAVASAQLGGPPEHVHDWRFDHRAEYGTPIETCADCLRSRVGHAAPEERP